MGKETEFGRKDYEIDEDAEEGDDDDGATDHASWDESEHFESMQTQYLDGDMEQKWLKRESRRRWLGVNTCAWYLR